MRYVSSHPTDLERNELLLKLFVEGYSVLETYLKGNSRKNELYFAKHIDYFKTQYDRGVRITCTRITYKLNAVGVYTLPDLLNVITFMQK